MSLWHMEDSSEVLREKKENSMTLNIPPEGYHTMTPLSDPTRGRSAGDLCQRRVWRYRALA